MQNDLPSGTVTFLFTDVEGSTRLLHSLGAEAYAEELAEHRRAIREACASHQGVEVDTQGDAFFFAFPTAQGALAAASTFTAALAPTQIRVRVGLHTGTPLFAEEGYVGADVHFAARVASAAHGGQVVCSAATAELVETPLSSLGSHRLKDIAEAVSLYQLGAGSFPALKTIANTNLPTPASSFLGRQEELYEADTLLQETRLLTITGPGGAGKTRFALELARRAREERFRDYEDGVFSCFLSSLRDPTLVLATIAQALSVREQPGLSALETLSSYLETKRMLLLLDNLEHLLECAPELSELLAACSGLTVLVTSRELLRLSGELPYELPPLAEAEGIALFCERARSEPSEAIAELCHRLEGLPLAIELAAARMGLLSPEQLLARLSGRLDLLKGTRDADPRQQTLRATIQWSYDLLSPQEEQLFARLSVFAGGCTLEAAEEVCAADLGTLESLLDKSLLRRSDTEFGPRYWMLETIREFAADRLEARGEAAESRDRHLRCISEWAERVEPELKRADQLRYLDLLEADHSNLRAALDHGLGGLGDVKLAGRLAVALLEFWDIHCHYAEGSARYEEVLECRDDVPPAVAAEALRGIGVVASRQGDQEEAIRSYTEAVRVHDSAQNVRGAARSLGSLAFAELNGGEVERAVEAAEQSVAMARLDGDPWTIACAVAALAATTEDQHLDEAEALYEESLRLFTEVGDSRNRAITLVNLAGLALQGRSYDRAELLITEAADLARIVDDYTHVAAALTSKAEIALRQERYDDARSSLQEAILLAGRYDLKFQLSRCLIGVALLASIEQELESVARLVGSAVSLVDGGQDFHPDDEYWQSTLLALQTVLDAERFEQIIEEWGQRSLEDVVTEAIEVLDRLGAGQDREGGSSGK